MQKSYSRINWENYPSEATPLNERNLNRLDYATNEIDDRVITLDTTKLDVATGNSLIKNINVNNETGVITITKLDNTTVILNTNLGKIAVNFTYDRTTQDLILELNDGTTERISLASLIQDNEFVDSPTIGFTVSGGNVTAIVKSGSIGDEQLRTNYLADIRLSEANARASEINAEASDIESRSWAIGGTQTRTGEDTNNSRYYSQVAETLKNTMEDIRDDAEDLLETATNRLTGLNIMINYSDGCMYYDINSGIQLNIDSSTGQLQYEITT